LKYTLINERKYLPKRNLPSLLKQLTQIKGQAFVLSAEEIDKFNPIIDYELAWLQSTLGNSFDAYQPQGFTKTLKATIINSEEAQNIFSSLSAH
jgi:hypothetical protein